ncbi:shikimate dehydrogenase family protein [Bifidobacterium moukalabense]|uniref:shikimate dehydrogenase family protein n=1 Tax=Bifidobacterium moukalabense TaxID=1333651 RepID=UPI0010F7769C|nr:shikimate dehydrogenase [Bifidobacterium moukalabense]
MPNVNHRCAVLGKPIGHSLSPVLHNAAYRAMGLEDWFYGRHEVGEGDLKDFLRSLDPSWAGLSLTMPLKKTVQPYGEPSDMWAKELKVANTAIFDWTRPNRAGDADLPHIRLYNTDVPGIRMAFEHSYRTRRPNTPADHAGNAVIIGNGNTATSALAACTAMAGIGHITVVARHPGRNTELEPLARKFLPGGHPIDIVTMDDALDALAGASVAINTIPGLAADGIAATLTENGPVVHGTLLDVVYDPRPTKLMQAWRRQGGYSIGGEEMLLYQAVIQVLLMTGVWDGDPSTSDAIDMEQGKRLEHAMRAALEEAL